MIRFLPLAAGLLAAVTIIIAAPGWFTPLSVAGGIALCGGAMVVRRAAGSAVAAAAPQALLLAAVAAAAATTLADAADAGGAVRQVTAGLCAIALVAAIMTAIAALAWPERATSGRQAHWAHTASLALAGMLAVAAAPLAAGDQFALLPHAAQLVLIALAQVMLIAATHEEAACQTGPEPAPSVPEKDKSFALAVSIGHEIRQPLFAGQLAAHNLLARLDRLPQGETETLRPTAEKIGRHIDQAIAIADHTLELARFRSRPASRIDLAALIGTIIDAQRPLLDSKAVAISFAPPPAQRFEAIADRTGLEQVILNIIANACDSIERRRSDGRDGPGAITINLSREAGRVICTLTDNGAGIDPRIEQSAFEPFVSTRTGKVGGLGLFLSREILRHGGGDIMLRGNGEAGASVTISLQAAD